MKRRFVVPLQGLNLFHDIGSQKINAGNKEHLMWNKFHDILYFIAKNKFISCLYEYLWNDQGQKIILISRVLLCLLDKLLAMGAMLVFAVRK